MNCADFSGMFVIITDVATTVVNLRVMTKISKQLKNNCRLNGRCLWLKKISNRHINCKEKSQKLVRKEKIADKKYYAEKIKKLRYLLDEAYQQMQQGQYRYAIYDAKCVMKMAIKILLRYKNKGYATDDLLMNIKICERKKLLGTDKDFINSMYEVYHMCGCEKQIFNKGKYIKQRKVHFVIMQLKDLLNFVEGEIIYS